MVLSHWNMEFGSSWPRRTLNVNFNCRGMCRRMANLLQKCLRKRKASWSLLGPSCTKLQLPHTFTYPVSIAVFRWDPDWTPMYYTQIYLSIENETTSLIKDYNRKRDTNPVFEDLRSGKLMGNCYFLVPANHILIRLDWRQRWFFVSCRILPVKILHSMLFEFHLSSYSWYRFICGIWYQNVFHLI